MEYYARFVEGSSSFQCLSDHIHNVANMAAIIGERNSITNICLLSGYLHDMGKYTDDFQKYIKDMAQHSSLKATYKEKIDHAVYGAKYINLYLTNGDIEKRLGSRILRDIVIMCVCYHHGGLNDYISVDGRAPIFDRLATINDDQLGIVSERYFNNCISEDQLHKIITNAVLETEKLISTFRSVQNWDSQETINYHTHMLVKMVYSILIDADRLDAYNFCSGDKVPPEWAITPQIMRYIKNLNFSLDLLRESGASGFLSDKINMLRQVVSDECKESAGRPTGIYTLTIPTGGGKTLSSLRFALEHIDNHKGKKSEKIRIIYVLPYTTIIEQNAARIREVLCCQGSELLEHHSAYQFSMDSESDETQYKLLTERWDAPIVITTQVQFLNALYRGGTQSVRRLHSLANSVIIVDEVQTIPLKCTYLVNAALNSLSQLWNSTIVLCTATQPNYRDLKVPVLLSNPAELVMDGSRIYRDFTRMRIINSCRVGGFSFNELARLISNLTKKRNSTLIVMNTKSGVKAVYDELSSLIGSDNIVYITTYLCPFHRRKVISELKKKLIAKEKILVISTNLIECGVDLSFELVVRNLCGLPSIIQSSGRGNRHGEFDCAETHIVNATENIGKMEELGKAQNCMNDLLCDFQENENLFGGTLLSQNAINYYYHIFMDESLIKDKLGFPVSIPNLRNKVNLYNLVATRDVTGSSSYRRSLGIQMSFPLRFVGNEFYVINDLTDSVLVPYNDDAEWVIGIIISEGATLSEKKRALTQVQQYSINLYKHDIEKIRREGKLIPVQGFDNLYVLKSGSYSDSFGILVDGEIATSIL